MWIIFPSRRIGISFVNEMNELVVPQYETVFNTRPKMYQWPYWFLSKWTEQWSTGYHCQCQIFHFLISVEYPFIICYLYPILLHSSLYHTCDMRFRPYSSNRNAFDIFKEQMDRFTERSICEQINPSLLCGILNIISSYCTVLRSSWIKVSIAWNPHFKLKAFRK